MSRYISLILAFVILLFMPADASSQKKRGTSKAKTEQTSGKKSTAKKGASSGKSSEKKSSWNADKGRTEKQVKADKSQINKSIQKTQQQITLNAEETSKKLNQLNLVEGEIEACNARILHISFRIDSISAEIKVIGDSIVAMNENLQKITDAYVKSLKRAQGKRAQKSNLAFVFSSDSFQQAYRRSRYVKQLGKWRARRAKEIVAARQVLEEKKMRLQVLVDEATTSKVELSKEKATLETKHAETGKLVNELRSQGASLQTVMSQQKAKAAALDRELDAVIAREAAKVEAARKAEEAAKAEKARKEAAAKEAKRKAEEEAKRQAAEEAARKAAEAEAARKAEEVRRSEAAQKAAEEAARFKEAEAEKARKEAEKAKKEAKKEDERKAAAAKAAEAEAKKKAAEEAKKAAAEAEAETKRKQKEQKEIEERQKKERKQKPVKRDRKQESESASSSGGQSSGTLKTPDSAADSGTAAKSVETATTFADLKGKLPFPITGNYTIVKKFGRQKHPSLPHVETDNAGIDMETSKGAAVRSVGAGEVSAVFKPDGYNTVVVIRHGSYLTVYANLGTVSVSTGQTVKAGQNIGTVYSDPNDNGRSVLHFEVRNGRTKENPEAWLRR